jgi:hypothetical protein
MRKIEQEMLEAIAAKKAWRKDNTEVSVLYLNNAIRVSLHGNLIAIISPNKNTLTLYDCGYRTATTKSRLNALLSHYNKGFIWQVQGTWFYRDYFEGITQLWNSGLVVPLYTAGVNMAKTPDNLEFVF